MNKLVDAAAILNQEINDKKKVLEGYKKELKMLGETAIAGEQYYANVETYETKTFNEEQALEVVQRIGASWLIKPTVDIEKLKESIAIGEIDAKEFSNCIVRKPITKITFKQKPLDK